MTAKVYTRENFAQVFFQGNWYSGFKTEKEAQQRCNELNFEFFSKNEKLLPKGIIIDRANERFRFFIRLNNETVKFIKSSKDLNKLIGIRNHILKNLLDLF